VLVAMGLQSLDPVALTIAGGVVILNAALVDGPLGAFRLFSRRAHRVVDLVVIAGLLVVAVAPFLDVDNASRAMLAAAAFILGVIWWNSAFERRSKRVTAGTAPVKVDRSEAIGRGAGRMAGGIAKAVRDRTKSD